MSQRLYKICKRAEWKAALARGSYEGSADDLRDGYIHLSTAAQLPGTAAKHFAGQADLVLLIVAEDRIGPTLKYEPARGGALFPHIYGPLELAAVSGVVALPLDADGHVQLPKELTA